MNNAEPSPLLRVRDLAVTIRHRSGDVPVVRNVSFDVRPAEVVGILGESGSGKSVTSLAVMGLLPEHARVSGEVTFRGRSLLDLNDRQWSKLRGNDISMVFQNPMSALTPVFTIGHQLVEALRIHDRRLSRSAARSRAAELLTLMGIPDAERRLNAFPHEFSGGMRQRVMIAMAIANDPSLIIADEPTTALDVTVQAQILRLLRRARDLTGAALVLITHDVGVLAAHADRVVVVHGGHTVEQGSVDDIIHRPQSSYTVTLVNAFTDSAAPAADAEPAPDRSVVLRVTDLVRHFSHRRSALMRRSTDVVRAVDGISFAVCEGEVMALIGESGSGKSTTALQIVELTAPQGGTIEVCGHDVGALTARDRLALRRDIQLVFQDPQAALDPRLTIRDAIAEPLTVHGASRREQDERVDELLRLVGLDPTTGQRHPHEFSGGQRQRIAIARALATRPRILILDEPVSALDLTIRGEIVQLLQDLRHRFGLTYLFIGHDLTLVRRFADTVSVMYRGRIVEAGPASAVLDDPQHPYTVELKAAAAGSAHDRAAVTDGDGFIPGTNPGCGYRARCALYAALSEESRRVCNETQPEARAVKRTKVACHHA